MTIHIEELTFEAIIGILDFERVTPQTVVVDAQIIYDFQDEFINYADVISLIEKMMLEHQYELLETALSELIKELSIRYSQMIKINLKITKPNIIKNAKVALSIEWLRQN